MYAVGERESYFLDLNNSFSSRASFIAGKEYLRFDEGKLFSSSGNIDKSYYFLYSGEEVPKSDVFGERYLLIKLDPNTYFPTGISIVRDANISTDLYSSDYFPLYTKCFTDVPQETLTDGDVLLFQNSGIGDLYANIVKTPSDIFYFQIQNFSINNTIGIAVEPHQLISLSSSETRGQKIFGYNIRRTESETIIEDSELKDEVDYSVLQKLGAYVRDDEGSWNTPEADIVSFLPLCIIDFDRESIVSLSTKNILVRKDPVSYGINGKSNGVISF